MFVSPKACTFFDRAPSVRYNPETWHAHRSEGRYREMVTDAGEVGGVLHDTVRKSPAQLKTIIGYFKRLAHRWSPKATRGFFRGNCFKINFAGR